MADSKLTALSAITAPISTDITYLVSDPGGSPAGKKMELSRVTDYAVCNGRLTLETGVPISTADQTAKTTLYFTPYKGNRIGLYDGSGAWTVLAFTELSLNISAFTASKPYDIFCYNNSGTAALEGLVWTDGTTRATALTAQDGIYVKTGATDRRYLGTIYVNSSGGQTDDAEAIRGVWNYYNRVRRSFYKTDTTNSWSYTTATWRSANNSTANRIAYILGFAEELINLRVDSNIFTQGSTANDAAIGLALDATNTNNATQVVFAAGNSTINIACSIYNYYSAIGYHYVQWTEYANVSGTGAGCTFYGDDGNPSHCKDGISGWIMG
jgi:hypothetical protein